MNPAKAFARLLIRLCVPDGMALPVVAGPLRGAWWLAGSAPGPAKGLSTVVNRCEPGQLSAALRLAPRDGIVFDVGANVGLYTLLFARASRAVYAFEPFPSNLGWLARTLARNRIGNVHVIPWAAGAVSGLAAFAAGEHHSEGKVDAAGDLPVHVVALDEFAARYGAQPALIKIDVEGTELDVLKGAEGILRARKPALLLSTHGDAVKAECLAYLKGLGYRGFEPLDAPNAAQAREFAVTA